VILEDCGKGSYQENQYINPDCWELFSMKGENRWWGKKGVARSWATKEKLGEPAMAGGKKRGEQWPNPFSGKRRRNRNTRAKASCNRTSPSRVEMQVASPKGGAGRAFDLTGRRGVFVSL